MQNEKYIVHIDMDAFFASIEQRDNPKFLGKPVVVGADPKQGKGRGVVSTCSYEARKYGIHSAMPISIAYKKCPHAFFLPVDMDKYSDVSSEIYKIFYNFTPDVEPISIDEAFLDITGSHHLFGAPLETCVLIKSRIKKETGLTASAGLAPIKMAAKIASDLKKPDGLVEVRQDELLQFLWPLPVEKIWGLGQKGKDILDAIGIKTIGSLAKMDRKEVIKLFGKEGIRLWQLANGIDERKVVAAGDAKSVSNEYTFMEDESDKDRIEATLLALCEKVAGRLRNEKLKGRTITLKIRLEGFETYTRSNSFENPTDFDEVIWKQVKSLFNDFDLKKKKIRLLGVKVSNFSSGNVQGDLFQDVSVVKMEKIHSALDKIRERFGDNVIHRAKSKLDI